MIRSLGFAMLTVCFLCVLPFIINPPTAALIFTTSDKVYVVATVALFIVAWLYDLLAFYAIAANSYRLKFLLDDTGIGDVWCWPLLTPFWSFSGVKLFNVEGYHIAAALVLYIFAPATLLIYSLSRRKGWIV